MSEEIIHRWSDPAELVLDVMGAVKEGPPPSPHELWGVLGDPSLVSIHRFRLMDANGNEVAFPLNLISDTSITSMDDN